MRKGNDVFGKPVVIMATGKQGHKVQDIVFDPSTNRVLGFIVEGSGLFGPTIGLPIEHVKSIGEDAIVIEAAEALSPVSELPAMHRILQHPSVLKGTKVMTESGKNLGNLKDVYFDEVTGQVEGYEVSGGLFADAYSGRSMIPVVNILRLGQDVAFVPDSTLDLMEQQMGGLKGAATSTATSTKEKASQAKDKLTEAAGGDKSQATKAQAHDFVEKARTSAHETGEKVKSDAAALLETVKARAGEYKDRAAREVEEARIKRAVGRPTNRVVMDHSNNTLLNTGDIITFDTIEKARQAGVLDILLGSVYDREPELSPEDMKVKEPARAGIGS